MVGNPVIYCHFQFNRSSAAIVISLTFLIVDKPKLGDCLVAYRTAEF